MKTALFALITLSATAAFADVSPTQSEMDFGISAGALLAKTTKVKAGKYLYNVIVVDLKEPACNSTQAIVTVEDSALTETGSSTTVTYNLGVGLSSITSVKAVGNKVEIKATQNSIEDCTKNKIVTYSIQYRGNAGKLGILEK